MVINHRKDQEQVVEFQAIPRQLLTLFILCQIPPPQRTADPSYEHRCECSLIHQSLDQHLLCTQHWPKIGVMCMHAKLLQWCLTLCNPMDSSPPGFSIHWDSPGKSTGVGCYSFLQGFFPTQGLSLNLLCLLHWQVGFLPLVVQSLSHVQFFATPTDCSLPGSPVHGIFQARIPEWVAISFSKIGGTVITKQTKLFFVTKQDPVGPSQNRYPLLHPQPPHTMSSVCLSSVEKLQPPRPSPILKSKFNQRSEEMQKEKETVNQDKIITL